MFTVLHTLLESLGDFRKDLLNRVKANMEANDALVRQHKWKYKEGDIFLSTKTGKTYTITGKLFQKRVKFDDNHKRVGEPALSPAYRYEASDGEQGTFWEDLMGKTLKKINEAEE